MISVPFFVPASLVLLILKYRTLLEISFLEEIKLETERDRTGRTEEQLNFWKYEFSSSLPITILFLISYNI